ncbi:hypothetical protein CO614_00085 [Lysobacteraceae bacterium NML120232]|nr:hypothetical protein CO608_01900 [Xanthomonadaceae bacterium NML08-0793]PJK13713.1 hypothetical protein CO614_00085 [Xanthomonadaceae bacterium NML120232]
MKARTAPSPSTLHQRAYRERMRSAGLVKKDVWILPEYTAELAAIEKSMRAPGRASSRSSQGDAVLTLVGIHEALSQTRAVIEGLIAVEWLEGADPSLHLVMHEYGGLSVFIAKSGEHLIVEAWLWPLDAVADAARFNAHVLTTHKLLPLSTVGIDVVAGVPGYIMFGTLDANSRFETLMFEVETLADNVINASEAWLEYLRPEFLAGAAA